MKIVYSYYSLDILHIGHIIMMKKSKEIAGENGILIAGILTDSAIIERKNKPILSFEERFEIAKSIRYLDKVVPQNSYSPLPNLEKLKPNILMESTSHTKKDLNDVRKYMHKINGEVILVPYYEGQSSTIIKKSIKERNIS